MGDVTVPGVTDEELLRAAAMARVREATRYSVPDLKPHEFTRRDWLEDDKALMERELGYATASRDLDSLVEMGVLERAWRRDPRVGKRVWGYWFAEGVT